MVVASQHFTNRWGIAGTETRIKKGRVSLRKVGRLRAKNGKQQAIDIQ